MLQDATNKDFLGKWVDNLLTQNKYLFIENKRHLDTKELLDGMAITIEEYQHVHLVRYERQWENKVRH